MSKAKKLYVITTGSYPYGEAATNRHLSYLKGLVESGVEVSLIVLMADRNHSKLSNQNKGVFNGVEFEYIIPIECKPKGVFDKVKNRRKSVKKALELISNSIDKSKDNKLLVLLTDAFLILPFLSFGKRNGIRVYHERTEYPDLMLKGLRKRITLDIYLRIVNRFDGAFVITTALLEYFSAYMPKEKLLHLPMTVESERFMGQHDAGFNTYGRYIAYCGSMHTDKDGVPYLIKAFDILANKHKDINLVLIGDNTNKTGVVYNTLNTIKNKNRVFFTGKVERDEMPKLLANAEALALARPDNKQAKGGFPTKLGEYLATGNPVAITSVGEIPNYLTHNKNAYMCKPDSELEFAKILIELFDNIVEAKRIGVEGQKLALNVFSYKVQSERLKLFLFP